MTVKNFLIYYGIVSEYDTIWECMRKGAMYQLYWSKVLVMMFSNN